MPKVLEMVCLLFWCPQEVLLDDQIVKLGVNINGDIIKLAADYGTKVHITSCLHTEPVELHVGGYQTVHSSAKVEYGTSLTD